MTNSASHDAIQIRCNLVRSNFSLDINISIPAQGVSVIFGESGSGKTSILRFIAGLDSESKGELIFKSSIWQNHNLRLPTYKRSVGYVFQEASLLPHLSAKKNLEFATKRANNRSIIDISEAIQLLDLNHVLNNTPDELSGGERQRVAIARALLIQPKLLLMDEPLASLDDTRKQELLPYLERLKRELSLPIVYVTHSVEELSRLADHLVVIKNGSIVANGQTSEVLSRLDLPIVLGEERGAIIEGTVSHLDKKWKLAKINLSNDKSDAQNELWFKDDNYEIGKQIRLRILARDVSLALEKQSQSSILNSLPGSVIELRNDDHKAQTLVKISIFGHKVVARISSRSAARLALHEGQKLWAQIKSVAIVK